MLFRFRPRRALSRECKLLIYIYIINVCLTVIYIYNLSDIRTSQLHAKAMK